MGNNDLKFNKYSKQGAYHWRRVYGSFYEYDLPQISRYRLAYGFIVNNLGKYISETKGLDVGCGEGVFMHQILSKGGQIDGLDLENDALDLADKLLKKYSYNYNYNLHNASCDNMPLQSESKDYIIALEVVEHLSDINSFLLEVQRILKQDGIFVLSTPRRKLNGMIRDSYHIYEFTEGELEKLLSHYFHNVIIKGAWHFESLRKWRSLTGNVLVDRLFRLFWRTFYMLRIPGTNVFETQTTINPNENWDLLFSVATNKKTESNI